MKKASSKGRSRFRSRLSAATVKNRATQGAVDYDSPFRKDLTTFSPKAEGDYRIRFLPPTWDDATHFGLDVYIHYNMGSDNSAYLCLKHMKGEDCPVCEEQRLAQAEGDDDYARELRAVKRVLVWLIDRKNEQDGPLLWAMPWTIDKDLAKRIYDDVTNEILPIDDCEEGFDVLFSREGTGLHTKYMAIDVARRSTPLVDDDRQMDALLDFIEENPLPDCLNFYDYEHIARVFSGKAVRKDEEESDDAPVSPRHALRNSSVVEEDVVEEDVEEEAVETEHPDSADTNYEEEEIVEERPSRRRRSANVDAIRQRLSREA